MEQSSCPFTCEWTYDVFLNFRGPDTRTGFTRNLYEALRSKGIPTFMDNNLEKGEEIKPALLKAIQNSRMAITVLSKDYATSTFCLRELVEILKCINHENRLVLPVFYDIEPSEVRHLTKGFGKALAKHEQRFGSDKETVEAWKFALRQVSNLSGWHFKPGIDIEYEVIKKITEEVFRKTSRIPLYVTDYPVGLESRARRVMSLLDIGSTMETRMVGIHGLPGIGKTTTACAVYNLIADNFEGVCFLGDIKNHIVRHGLPSLQEKLLFDIVKEDFRLQNVHTGIQHIKRRLCRKKILLLLDNVDKLQQLEAIAGCLEWFGVGSRIIITTRDKHLLDVHGVRLKSQYEVELMNHYEALELFRWKAFKSNEADPNYKEVLNQAVRYCNGLPLALDIIGNCLCGQSLNDWYSALDTYRRVPNNNVQEILRLHCEGLGGKEKEIFLDIACFFKGYSLEYLENIVQNGRGFKPDYSIKVLIQKSLVKVERGIVMMHDLIQDMGREIVRLQSEVEPGGRSRLWFSEDILHVLKENTGTNEIEVIILHLPEDKEVQWNGNAFKKMKNLKILIIEGGHFSRAPKYLPNSLGVLDWPKYPSSSLPSNFHSDKLGILDLSNSCIIELDQTLKNFMSLNEMNLSYCTFLERVPDVSGIPNLTKLNLLGCRKLIEVHDSVGFLGNLEFLDASHCCKLKIFPNAIKSTYLEYLGLSGCSSLLSSPKTFGIMDNITRVDFIGDTRTLVLTAGRRNTSIICGSLMVPKIEELMKRLGCSSKCKGQDQKTSNSLVPSDSRELRFNDDCSSIDGYLSTWAGFFPNFTDLHLSCSNLTVEYLVKGLPLFPNLVLLNVSMTVITIIPECIKECHFLTTLFLDYCQELQEIKGVPPNIKTLSAKSCESLSAESASVLLSETLHEHGGTLFTLPGKMIPEWFDHSCVETSLSFWFRNKFPKIALCFVNSYAYRHFFKSFRLLINGMQKSVRLRIDSLPFDSRISYGIIGLPSIGHILLLDLQSNYVLGGEEGIEFITDAWNHVEVAVDGYSSCGIGIYVYKQQNSAEDVRFTDPTLQK